MDKKKFKGLNQHSEDVTNHIDSYKAYSSVSSVLKELIENSIDADSTEIKIIYSKEDLSYLEIIDDGKGISEENMSSLCKRFVTSKEEEENELYLKDISTFGYRGEALAILSYISTLSISSKVVDNKCVKMIFSNGKCTSKSNDEIINDSGTKIKVERLFYSNDVVKQSLDKSKEIDKILKMVQSFSIQFPFINFSLYSKDSVYTNKAPKIILNTNNNVFKPLKMNIIDLTKNYMKIQQLVEVNENATTELAILDLEIKKKTVELKNKLISSFYSSKMEINLQYFETSNDILKIKVEIFYTKPSFNEMSNSTNILFIGNRLVTKKTNFNLIVENVYKNHLIAKGKYFCYMSIEIPEIDFNTTSDKGLIILSKEKEVLIFLEGVLKERVSQEQSSINFYTSEYKGFTKDDRDDELFLYPKEKIRVDPKTQTLENFLQINKQNQNLKLNKESEKNFEVNKFLSEIKENLYCYIDETPTSILNNNIYVGTDDDFFTYIQYNTSLYLINTEKLLAEFFLFRHLSQDSKAYNLNNVNHTLEDCIFYSEKMFDIKDKLNIEELRKSLIINKELLKEINIIIENDKFISIPIVLTNECLLLPLIPLLIYNICKLSCKESSENKGNLKNLSFLLEALKIISILESLSLYEGYLVCTKEGEEVLELSDNLKNIKSEIEESYILMKKQKFKFRKCLKSEEYIEIITNTETLYTVFERC